MEIQTDNVNAAIENVTALCREYFKPTAEETDIIKNHIIQADSLKVMRMMAELEEEQRRDRA
jgi:acyl carrier protein